MAGRSPEALGPAVARLRAADGTPVGTGFLLAPGTVATCAHVVAQALSTDERDAAAPALPVTVEFPLQRGVVTYEASVTAWRPVTADGSGDIALLRLPEQAVVPPDTVTASPVPLTGVGDVWDHRFRILAFPATSDQGAWIGGRLRGAVAQGWISMETDGTAHRITPGCSGAPVWDEELGAVVGMTVATDRGPTAVTSYLIPAAALLDLQPGLRRCPYRGLDAFREEDAEHFFGREEETERLLDAVDRHVVVPVVGPSGSGKTSLVRAGAIPRLRAQGHTVSEIRPLPGTRASLTLARALAPLLEAGLGPVDQERSALALADLLDVEEGPSPSDLALRLLDHCGPRGHVFFLNQFEEIVATEPAVARALLGLLLATVSVPADGKRLRVIATLRSASLDDLVEPGTARVLSDCAQVVAPPGRAGLLRAVEGPAARVPGLTLEAGLAERVVDDAEDEPGHLPMVEFALTELWSHERGVRLTHAGYEALGGVAGALSTHAEQRVGEVIADHGEDPVRRLFTQLARPDDSGGFTRKPVRLAPLPPDIRATAEALATRTRFVRITHGGDGEPIVDLAHEELVRSWRRLRRWLEASRDFRAWQERLLQALAHWKDTGEETGALLRGTMLATSLEQLADPARREDITPAERDFIESSRRHQQRSMRRWRAAAAVLVVLAMLAGGLAVQAWRTGAALEARTRATASRLLAEQSSGLVQTHPVTSVRIALAAWHNAHSKEARQALLDAYFKGASAVAGHAGAGGEEIKELDMTPDGSTVVTASGNEGGDGDVRVWTGLLDGEGHGWRVPVAGGVPQRAELSDDGRLLAVALKDGAVHVYDLPDRELLWTKPRPALDTPGLPTTVALDFSEDGGRLLRLVADTTAYDKKEKGRSTVVQVWDVPAGSEIDVAQRGLSVGSEAKDAALMGEGSDAVYLSVSDDRGVAHVRALRSGELRRTVPDAEWLAGRGTTVVVGGRYGRHSVVSLTRGEGSPGRRFTAIESYGTDSTGRYTVESSGGAGSATLCATDLRTGRRYCTTTSFVKRGYTLHSAVLPGKHGTPRMLLAAGADLVVLRTRLVHALPLPDVYQGSWSIDETYVRSADGLYRAQLDKQNGERGVEEERLVVARRGHEGRTEPVVVDEFGTDGSAGAVFTTDSRRLVLWGSDSDVLSVRPSRDADDVRVHRFPAGIREVVPLYGSMVAVLTADQLIRYDTESGKLKVIRDEPCGDFQQPCRAFQVRPPEREEVLVGAGTGSVAVWDMRRGTKRSGGGVRLAEAGAEGFGAAFPVVFAPRGKLAAVSLGSRTITRWNVETGEYVGPTIASKSQLTAHVLAEDGTLLTGQDPLDLWRPIDTDEPFVSLDLRAASEDIHLTADHLTVVQANTEIRIPLNPDAWHEALCRNWTGSYTPAEQRILADAGAVADSPCP